MSKKLKRALVLGVLGAVAISGSLMSFAYDACCNNPDWETLAFYEYVDWDHGDHQDEHKITMKFKKCSNCGSETEPSEAVRRIYCPER